MNYLIAFLVASIAVFVLDAPSRRRRRTEDRQAILDAIEVLQPHGTTLHITDEAERRLGRRLSFGAIFVYLNEFERAGVITWRWGATTAERGWRLYQLVGGKPPLHELRLRRPRIRHRQVRR